MTDTKITDDPWLKNFDMDTRKHIITFCNNAYLQLEAKSNCNTSNEKLRILKKIVHTGGFSNKQLTLPIIKELSGYLISNTWPKCIQLSKALHIKYCS
jgi:hypothetical protein